MTVRELIRQLEDWATLDDVVFILDWRPPDPSPVMITIDQVNSEAIEVPDGVTFIATGEFTARFAEERAKDDT